MDRHGLWKDTMLIVWTDHGFMLGEHDCWAKIWMPFYQEIAHTPFFVWDPRTPACGVHRTALVQPSLDIAPTLLAYFGLAPTPDMLGQDLTPVMAKDSAVREAAIFGLHGAQVNVTDGRYVYMRGPAAPENTPLNNYTLMPTAMRGFLDAEGLRNADMAEPFSFTKGMPTVRVPARSWVAQEGRVRQTLLWDLEADPCQGAPIRDEAVERRMQERMIELMRECDAPPEQYRRLGLA
jgi:hypothetical protein